MKKFRFFSVVVAVVAILFGSVWAGSVTYGIGTLNGFATGETSVKCFTLPGTSSSYLTSVTFTGKLSSACNPSTGYIKLYQLVGAQQTLIGNSANISLGTNVSNVPIPITSNKYPANGTYCVSGYVKYNNSNTQSTACGITLTGSATFNWSP